MTDILGVPEHLSTVCEQTGLSLGKCAEALEQCNGQIHKCMDLLLETAETPKKKKKSRFLSRMMGSTSTGRKHKFFSKSMSVFNERNIYDNMFIQNLSN